MFKKILNFLLLSSITSAIFMLFFACSVGLGESVDTEVPKIEITYPPASSPVRDWFYLAGTASDDKGVASVSVSAENISTNEITDLGTFTPLKDGTWAVKINEKDSAENYKLKDGTYTFCVIAKDTSSQKSAPAYRTIEVDNTPPVFVIKNPGTIKAGKPSAFGSILKIVGAAADDHDIYELSLAVYDNPAMEGEPKAVISEKNVDKTDGINVTLARYNLAVDSGEAAADELHNNYLKIYDAAGGGNQNFFASVTLKDSAGVWQDYTKNQPSSVGNSTNGGLYLNDSVYETLMGKKSKYGLSAADFMRLLNGTYKNTAVSASSEERTAATAQASLDDEAKKEILKILGERKTETSKTPLAFSLNKNANPTYTVMGFSFDSSAESIANLGGHKAAKQNSLTFKAQAGLDGAYVKPTTLKIYLFGPYENDFCTAEKLEEIYSDPDLFYERSIKTAKESAKAANGGTEPSEELVAGFAKAQILKDYSSSGASTAETFSESIELPSFITKGKYYLLAATGEDEDGVKLMTSYYYGFVGESAGTPPAVSITGFADGVMKNSVSKIKVSGTLKSEETELAGVAYSIVVFDEIASKTVGTITGEVSSENFSLDSKRLSALWEVQDILKGTLSYENDYAAFDPEDGERFKYTVTVTGKDTTGLVSKDTRSFTVDRKVPEIKINDITPVAKKETAADGTVSKYIVNGKIKFSTVVTDTNLKNVKVTVTDGTKSETLFEGNSSTIEKEIDTTKYKDENFLTFKVEAEDSAENTAVRSKADVWVSQKTDKPEIKFTNGKSAEELGGSEWANVTNGQNVFGIENNNSANFTITDDDGLSLVRVTVFDENKKQIGSEGAVSVADAQLQAQPDSENAKESAANPVEYKVSGGSTSYALAYKLPQKAGKYKILIEVFDTGHDTADEANKVWHTTKCENYVLISEGRISISFAEISNNTCQVKADEKATIRGTVSLSALEKLASIERFASKETTVTEENGESVTKWIKVSDCSSKYPYEESTVETEKITAKAEGGKIVWEDNIPAAMIVDGTQHFFYKATDIAGNSAEIELICNGDGTLPEIKNDSEVYEKYKGWVNSTSVKLSVIAADVNGYEPSGIAKVSYSYKKGESDITGELSCDGKPCNADGKIVEGGKYYKYTATSDLSETPSSGTMITFTAKDKVGNKSDMPPLAYKVDTTAPSAGTPSIVPSQVLNNSGSVVVTYSASDALSGVKSVEFSTDSNMKDAKSVAEKAGTYAYPLAGLQDGERTVYVRVTDNAGNRSESVSSGSFIVDNTPPKVTVTSPASGNVVNKTISLSGTVVDNNLTKTTTPVLQYFDATGWKTLAFTSSTLDGQNWTIYGIDTTKLNNSTDFKEFEFKVQFTDDAGNVNESLSSAYKLKVDQNTDRPEIKLTNVKKTGSAISSNIVQGVISDDDGVAGNLKLYRIDKADYSPASLPGSSGSKWKAVDVESGTGIWKAVLGEDEKQGEKCWYFYIIDENGEKFCTAETSQLKRPYLSDSVISKEDNTTGISFFYDTNPPEIEVSAGYDGKTFVETNIVFGGADAAGKNKIHVRAIVTEEVGMASKDPVTLFVGGKKQEQPSDYPKCSNSKDENGIAVYTYDFAPINISDSSYKDGSLSISVTAEDSAGLSNKNMMNVMIDKTPPMVTIVSPTTSVSDAVTSAVSIKGLVQDSASYVERLMYTIPKNGVADNSQDWKDVGTSTSWEIKFASGAADSTDSLIYYVKAKNGASYTYSIESFGTEGIFKLPIWFKVKDTTGNEDTIKDQYVLVDSEGGSPKAWINSPENGATTSGVVTIYGGAIDNISVAEVRVQIDANNDGKFDADDYTEIRTKWNSNDDVMARLNGSGENWYILANGTNSWKLNVDSGCITEKDKAKSLRIRVKAFDNDGNSRDWTEPVTVKIDDETPVIKNLKLVQYGKGVTPSASSVPVTEREYISGMYISNVSVDPKENPKGKWYLKGEISDNQSVSSVTFNIINSSGQNNIRLEDESELNPNVDRYDLLVPLRTDESGVISYEIKAKDNNVGETSVSLVINIDSTPPSLYNTSGSETLTPEDALRLQSMGKILGTGADNTTVVNNNKFFTFGDVVSEAGSGLEYIAFYFERTGSKGGKRIYNPMFKDGNITPVSSKAENPKDGDVYKNEDGLVAMYVTDPGRKSEDSITIPSVNKNIRKGGLIKIAGSYSLITEVTGTTVKFSPSASIAFKNAEIILAQVVDHKITESLGSKDVILNDDGDEMIESITQLGIGYTWSASVDSTNIPDGPINIHVVAIDNAGNISKGSIATKVENNRPRIAKVLLGTDLNGNGTYDWNASSAPVTKGDSEKDTKDGKSFGEFSYFTALDSNSGKAQSVVKLNSDSFKVLGKLCIIPEFVGGNNGLGYMLEYPSGLSNAEYKTGAVTEMISKSAINDKVNSDGGIYKIDSEISDFGGIELAPSSGNISITFWDKTEETTQGTDSQWALLKIPVNLMTDEKEKPKSKIRPFYWNSSTENSVFIDGAIRGHIELEKDLTSSITSSLGDDDPKVSGKIKIEGTVYDNVRIYSISASVFGGTSSVVASYNAGIWAQDSSLPKCVESFTAEDMDMSQNGHTVKYTMIVDTEKLSDSAGLEKTIIITAKDWQGNTSEASSAQTVTGTITVNDVSYSTGTTNYYKMDVVPYVTQVWTDLSEFYRSAPSVYARSAKGKYPVNENETITLKGYNLGTSPKVVLNGIELTGSALSYNIGKTAKSGKLEVSVGNIKAVNNLNNDTAEYNLQPNGVNNNILNDNLEFDVWQFKAAATAKNGPILQPHMKVGPSGELGFSYANATLYFNMPGKASNSTTYGQTPFGRNFGGFTQNTFTYDSNGNAYGVALCPDTSGEPGMSANLQFFSRTSGLHGGEGGGDLNNNYYNQNYARRIENTSIKLDGSSISQHVNRVLSPSMATYTDGETTYVYVAYYDELSRQVRFRVGSVDSSGNGIGMGLVDLAGSSVEGRVAGSNDEPKLNKNTTRDSISGYSTSSSPSVETINVASVTSDIYVRVKSSYNYNHIYSWNGYSTSSYPGDAMTLVNGYYIYKMPSASSTSLILNDGTNQNQTGNLSISSSGVYEWSGSSLEKMTSGTISYQPPASSMPSYAGYQYCQVVAASGVSGGTAEYASATSKRAGQYVAVGSLSDGTAVMAWYDSGSGRLALSYNESPRTAQTTLADGTATWQDNSYYVSNENIRAGTYVSMAVDNKNGIHLAYYSATGGDLYYSYISDPKTKTVTKTVIVDSYGSVGTYPMIDVAKDSENGNFIPYISFRCESNSDTTASVKIAYPVNWDETGNVLNVLDGVDSDDRYTGNWEVSVVPTDNTPLTDYTNIGMNKDSSGVKNVFATGTDISKAWSATFAVSDSTTVYGNGTSNPVVSYAVSENGVLEMAQKK